MCVFFSFFFSKVTKLSAVKMWLHGHSLICGHILKYESDTTPLGGEVTQLLGVGS